MSETKIILLDDAPLSRAARSAVGDASQLLILLTTKNCGTGAGGFQEGNDCARGGGGGRSSGGESFPDEGKLVHTLYGKLIASGGFTYQPVTGDEPKKGFALSTTPGAEYSAPANTFSEQQLRDYLDKHADKLKSDPRLYVGGWVDTDAKKVYLDLSTIVNDPKEAYDLCRRYKQEGYFDLEKKETVLTKDEHERRKGKSTKAQPGPLPSQRPVGNGGARQGSTRSVREAVRANGRHAGTAAPAEGGRGGDVIVLMTSRPSWLSNFAAIGK